MNKEKLEELNKLAKEIEVYKTLFEVTRGTDKRGYFIWDNNWIGCLKEKFNNKIKISFKLYNTTSPIEYFEYLPKDVVKLIKEFS